MPFLLLLATFLLVGFLAFGGDTALLAYLQSELVVRHGWLSMEEFAELTAIGQLTPGSTATNLATYTGYAVVLPEFGFWPAVGASLLATLALAVPSLWLVPYALRQLDRHRKSAVAATVVGVLRPLACGLTGAALILLLTPDNLGSPTASPWQFGVSLLLFAFTVVGVRRYRFHPAFMLALCALAGRLLL